VTTHLTSVPSVSLTNAANVGRHAESECCFQYTNHSTCVMSDVSAKTWIFPRKRTFKVAQKIVILRLFSTPVHCCVDSQFMIPNLTHSHHKFWYFIDEPPLSALTITDLLPNLNDAEASAYDVNDINTSIK